jgi:hypothetical protein
MGRPSRPVNEAQFDLFTVPFSSDEFFAVFAAYNAAVWPAQLVLTTGRRYPSAESDSRRGRLLVCVCRTTHRSPRRSRMAVPRPTWSRA